MPKQEVGSTKWLGNKMKAKGLQKLRWYCQMCQKQCRDENGFKCHRMSDGHQRQMQLFVQDSNKFMDDFSQEFEQGFMQLMSHSYRSQRILANTVYCDYISNRHHTHMNSTIWVTLSNFCQYLGRTGQCSIDKTPKGWYLTYVDNTPEARARAAEAAKKEQGEQVQKDAHEVALQDAIANAMAEGGYQESEFTELQREEGDAPIAFAFGASVRDGVASSRASSRDARGEAPAGPSSRASSASAPANREGAATEGSARSRESSREEGRGRGSNALAEAFSAHRDEKGERGAGKEKKLSAMEQVRLEHEAAKQAALGRSSGGSAQGEDTSKRRRLEEPVASKEPEPSAKPWLAKDLIVKVMHQDLAGGKYYRKKARVERVRKDGFSADVRMVEGNDLIRVEQEMIETVIPNIGKPLRVIKGTHRGWKAKMRAVDMEGFCVTVELDDGTVMEGLGYDEVCKFEESST